MPLYSYKCPSCGWTGDRMVHIAVRDEQQCTATKVRPSGNGGLRSNAFVASNTPCGMRLLREEIPEDQARMSGQWSAWQRR